MSIVKDFNGKEKIMTKQQIEEYAVGYSFPTDYIEILLKRYNYNSERVQEILNKSYNEVVEEVQNAYSHITIMSILDFICNNFKHKAGDYVENDQLGQELTFDDITHEVGNLIVVDWSTESHAWYKIVMVEKIHVYEDGTRRLIFYDGKRQRGLVDERYFDKSLRHPFKAWRLN